MLFRIYEENPNERHIQQIVECLKDGGVIIYPTDTIYGIGCDITQKKSIERIAAIKGINPENHLFSFICHDLSHLSDYTRPINNSLFRLMKHNLPGAFTFVLEANKNVPQLLQSKRKTIGIRIPDNIIIRTIVRELGNPVLSSSIQIDEEDYEYATNPELIYETYKDLADIVIDGGFGDITPSTVVNCVGDEIEILRQGKGHFQE